MSDGLQLDMTLDRPEGIYGESVFFRAAVTHTFKSPMSLQSLEPANRALRIFLKKAGGEERVADQLSSFERDGIHVDEPRVQEGISLAPGQKMELRDDLLKWFGHIPAGSYKVWAEYRGIIRAASSDPVDLKISPAVILGANTPRWGLQSQDAMYSAFWAHRHEQGTMLFFQQLSPYLPRNSWHSIRTVIVNDQVSAHAACTANPENPVGHLYWFTPKGQFFFVPIDLKKGKAGPAVEVKKLPFDGWPIATGMSLKDGSFMVGFADIKRTRFASLHVLPTGAAKAYELDLGKNTPIGPCMCFFEHEMRLHFIWTKPRGRQVDYAMLPLDDLESGFATRTIHISNDPLLWFDAYLDRGIPITALRSMYLGKKGMPGVPPELEEPPPPKVMIWCVAGQGSKVTCTPVSARDSAAMHPVSFSSTGTSQLSVSGSVTTSNNGLSLLLTDGDGKLMYASTMRKSLEPLDKIIGIPLTQANHPSLVRGSDYPWVHLRFVLDMKMINYIRIEPEDEPDAVESETMPWQMEPEEEVMEEEDLDEVSDEEPDEDNEEE